MSLEIVPLREEYLGEAAVLVSNRYAALLEQVSLLPSCYAQASTWLPLLRGIAQAGPGVAALRGDRLAGFLAAWLMPSWRGKRSAYSPEWANAADLADSRRVYEAMYTHLSGMWAAERYGEHLVSMLASDRQGMDAWTWLGFGMVAVDAVRDLQPAQAGKAGVSVRRAGLQDLDHVMVLSEALWQHMTAPPIFLLAPRQGRDYYEEWLRDPGKATWLAYRGDEPVSFIRQGPANDDACTIIQDAQTTSIYGAFTCPSVRGEGIATALLDRSLEWARAEGYERCAVDFEPMNHWAARFWLRHFQPVCYSFGRHVDSSREPS